MLINEKSINLRNSITCRFLQFAEAKGKVVENENYDRSKRTLPETKGKSKIAELRVMKRWIVRV